MDCDSDGEISLSDAVFNLNYLFLGGSPPPAPFDACGPAPAGPADELGCDSIDACP